MKSYTVFVLFIAAHMVIQEASCGLGSHFGFGNSEDHHHESSSDKRHHEQEHEHRGGSNDSFEAHTSHNAHGHLIETNAAPAYVETVPVVPIQIREHNLADNEYSEGSYGNSATAVMSPRLHQYNGQTDGCEIGQPHHHHTNQDIHMYDTDQCVDHVDVIPCQANNVHARHGQTDMGETYLVTPTVEHVETFPTEGRAYLISNEQAQSHHIPNNHHLGHHSGDVLEGY